MPVVQPCAPYDMDDNLLLALCVWREARGESLAAKRGVVHTILNRIAMAPREGFAHDIRGNVLKPWAFSSFMQGDPNATKYPCPSSQNKAWDECVEAATEPCDDPTGGAVFYYSLPIKEPPHAWGPVEISARIGGLTFCRIAPLAGLHIHT